MRSGTSGRGGYRPAPAPRAESALRAYLDGELGRIAEALERLREPRLEVLSAPPARPRDGDVRLADGAGWDPGSGAGVYAYHGGAWRKLG